MLHKSDVEILIGKRPFEEKKVVEVEVVPEVAAPEAPAASDEQSSTEESI